ncbi:hypothetical protein TNCV_4957921 [Trichonephila clavipes]|nr:hypothetical protein TNCV_4957921 [Trichonephila clavipes]
MATGSYMTPIYSRSQSEVLGDHHRVISGAFRVVSSHIIIVNSFRLESGHLSLSPNLVILSDQICNQIVIFPVTTSLLQGK